jgi:hypothetical protein
VLLGFEFIPAGGGNAVLTDLFTLIELGVDPAVLTNLVANTPTVRPSVTTSASQDDDEETRWGWLALAAGAAGLALLAVWLWMGWGKAVDKSSGNADNSTNADYKPNSGTGPVS